MDGARVAGWVGLHSLAVGIDEFLRAISGRVERLNILTLPKAYRQLRSVCVCVTQRLKVQDPA